MRIRSAITTIATTIGTIVVVPFLQAPASKLSEASGFDKVLSEEWGPAMSWLPALLSSLSHNPWYIFGSGAIIGVAITLWADIRLKSSIDIPRNIDTHLRLQFYGNAATPSHLETRNIWRWYASCNIFVVNENLPNGTQKSTELRSWNIVAVFDKPITLQQVRIDGNGVYLPRAEVRDRSERHVFVVTPGDIGNAIVDFHISSL